MIPKMIISLWWSRGRALATALLILLATSTALAEELKIGGTGNALGTMRLLGEAFARENPDMKVTVLPSLGSSGAIKATPKGAIDIGLSSRPLTDEERKNGIVSVEYARTPTVFVVSTKSGVTAITLQEVADLYSGQLQNWPDGSPIRPLLRQPGDDNTAQIKALSPMLDQALTVAAKREGLPYAVNDQEAADKLESIPGAIGVSSLGLILSENRALRPLTLDGVEPTAANAAAGRYPVYKRFFLILQAEPSAKVQRFIDFMHSPAGHDVLTRTGHWTP